MTNDTSYIPAVLLVYTAILILLAYYLYPFLKKVFHRYISISIRIGKNIEKRNGDMKEGQKVKKEEEFPSILGKSKFNLSQSKPTAAADLKTGKRMEKEDTFVPENKKTIENEDGEGLDIPDDDDDDAETVNSEDEREEPEILDSKPSHEIASGLGYDELGKIKNAIENPSPTNREQEEAGKILCANESTDLVEKIKKISPECSAKITSLMEFHLKATARERSVRPLSKSKQKQMESEGFKDFDINSIF
jgi:hypothetical protein